MPAPASTHLQVLQAVAAKIQALPLGVFKAAQVYVFAVPTDREDLVTLPAVVVSPSGLETYPESGTNAADDTGFPALVTFVTASNQALGVADAELADRAAVRSAFRNRHLTVAAGTVYLCRLEPGPVIDPGLWKQQNINVGQFLVRALAREVRPTS